MKIEPNTKLAFMSALFGMTFMLSIASAQTANETVVYSTGLPELSTSQLSSMRNDALGGSASAANTLALRSGMGAGDTKDEIYWYSIAVEDGDKAARCRLASALLADDDPESMVRAHYWLSQIMANGSPDDMKCAKDWLEEAAAVESARKRHPK